MVLHCASLLRTIFASAARARERVHVQNVRDFPQTKLDNEINSPFLLNEHGDPRFFFQVFAKNSLIKNIFEEEKKFDSRTISRELPYGNVFGPCQMVWFAAHKKTQIDLSKRNLPLDCKIVGLIYTKQFAVHLLWGCCIQQSCTI